MGLDILTGYGKLVEVETTYKHNSIVRGYYISYCSVEDNTEEGVDYGDYEVEDGIIIDNDEGGSYISRSYIKSIKVLE